MFSSIFNIHDTFQGYAWGKGVVGWGSSIYYVMLLGWRGGGAGVWRSVAEYCENSDVTGYKGVAGSCKLVELA